MTAEKMLANDVAQRFGCDRALLEDTLRRVQAGEMSPSDATTRLLSESVSSPSVETKPTNDGAAETIASLIARLGTPPTDILDAWCQQMQVAAAGHFLKTGQPLASIDLHRWAINPSGQLLWNGHVVTANVDPSRMDAVSAQQIQQFRDSLIPARPDSRAAAATADDLTPEGSTDLASRSSGAKSFTKAKSKRERWPVARLVIGGLVVVGFAAIAWILINASSTAVQRNKSPVAQSDSPNTLSIFDPGSASTETPEAMNAAPIGSATSSATRLESFDDVAVDDSVVDVVAVTESGRPIAIDMLSLESLMPAATGFVEGRSVESPRQIDAPEPKNNLDPKITRETIDPLAETDEGGPEESPQATRASEFQSIQLPPPDKVDVVTELSVSARRWFHLEFPFEVPLGLRDADSGREIIDVHQEVAVATIKIGPDSMRHRWTAAASKTASSTSLIHGRLKTDSGETVYLRSSIEADPWPIDLERADVRPTWDLLGPMPPRVTRLSIEFQLPEDVEEGWIERIEPTSPRRSRGLAVLTPAKGESVSLGIRFDIRGGRTLSCRVRYAARLDPASPWHVVSRPMLEELADQLVSQSEILSGQITQMSTMYSQADSSQRRVLAPRRAAIELRGKSLRELSDRVAKLQSLVSKVEAGANLNLRVWVEWPDGPQTLLETKAADQ